MTWLFPAFLAGGALIGLPILLHLIRRQPKQAIPFPTLRFLGPKAVRESQKHRIRRWLVLLMRCALLLFFAIAFARPFWPDLNPEADASAIVLLDNSASMQAGERTAFNKQWAREKIGGLGKNDVVGILAMHPKPTWITMPGTKREEAINQLATWQPDYESSNFRPALRLAGEVLATMPGKKKHLFVATDHQLLGWNGVNFEQPLPPGIEIAFSPAPPEIDSQAAVVRADARTIGDTIEVTAKVQAFAPTEAPRNVYLLDETGQELGQQTITLIAGQNEDVRFEIPRENDEHTRGFTVALEADSFSPDDARHVVINPRDGMQVSIEPITVPKESTDFLRLALEASREGGLEALKLEDFSPESWPADGVILLRGDQVWQSDAQENLTSWLRQGGRAWLMLDGSPPQREWLKSLGVQTKALSNLASDREMTLQNWALDHPLLAPFEGESLLPLLATSFKKGYRLEGDALEPLAFWEDGGAAGAEMKVGQGRLLLTGFGGQRESGAWPLQASFLPLAHRALIWLGKADDREKAHLVGDAITLPPGRGSWKNLSSSENLTEMVEGAITPSRPGLYRFMIGNQEHLFAVNFPVEESDLATWPREGDWQRLQNPDLTPPPASKEATPVFAGAAQPSGSDNVWWWLLLAVVLLLTSELALSNRTAL